MAENLLILHPKDPFAPLPEADALETALREIGFVGEAFDYGGQQHFKPGGNYLSLLTFLGCSPVISLGEPGKTGDEFAHVRIENHPEARLFAGDNVKPPRCPGCGQREEGWKEKVKAWEDDPAGYRWQCGKCGESYPLHALRWRQSAVFGRLMIKIWGVFESEAVPADKLMNTLQSATGIPWQHSYVRFI